MPQEARTTPSGYELIMKSGNIPASGIRVRLTPRTRCRLLAGETTGFKQCGMRAHEGT